MKPTYLYPVLTALILPVVSAQIVEDDFNDGNDSGWERYSPLDDLGAPLAFTFPGGNSYRIQGPASPNVAIAGPARGGPIARTCLMRLSGWKWIWWTGTIMFPRTSG